MRIRPFIATLAGWGLFTIAHAQAGPEATIPFELKGGRPYVSADIDHTRVSLLVDLGGFDTIALNTADSAAVGAQGTASVRTYTASDGKTQTSPGLRFRTVTMGDATFGDIDGGAVDGNAGSYVGAGLLARKLVVLDYVRKQVRLYRSGDANALQRESGAGTFALDAPRGVLQAQLQSEGRRLTAAFDTGANYSVIRPSALNLQVRDFVPGTSPDIHELQGVTLGGAAIGELSAALIEFKGPPADIVLGSNFFQGRVVCLDVQAHAGAVR